MVSAFHWHGQLVCLLKPRFLHASENHVHCYLPWIISSERGEGFDVRMLEVYWVWTASGSRMIGINAGGKEGFRSWCKNELLFYLSFDICPLPSWPCHVVVFDVKPITIFKSFVSLFPHQKHSINITHGEDHCANKIRLTYKNAVFKGPAFWTLDIVVVAVVIFCLHRGSFVTVDVVYHPGVWNKCARQRMGWLQNTVMLTFLLLSL